MDTLLRNIDFERHVEIPLMGFELMTFELRGM